MATTLRRQRNRARELRRGETPAEELLWSELRDRRLNGYKFIRQEPVGPFIVDFLCRKRKLIVEIDGATHSTEDEIGYDRRRESYLEGRRFQIVRIQNDEVYREMEAVLETILAGLEGK